MKLFNFIKSKRKKDDKEDFRKNSILPATFERERELENGIDPIYLKPLSNGLLPGEIVLLDWINGKSENTKPPGYFRYTYGISVKRSIKRLKDKGFIEEASPNDALNGLKVNDLKEILRENNLRVTGKKLELVERIIESGIDVSNYIKETFYKITDKGENVFNEFYYIVPAHKNGSKDGAYCVASAIDFVKNNNLKFKPANRDISWAIFQIDYLKNHSQKMYGLARNNLLSMAKQLYRENKLNNSLTHYLNVAIMDLSGLANNARLDPPDLTYVSPGIADEIKYIIEEEGFKEEQISDIFSEAWSNTRQSIPFHYLNKDECYKCLMKVLEGDKEYMQQAIINSFEKIDKETFEEEYGLMLPVSYP